MSHHDLAPRPEMGGYILREVHKGRADGILIAREDAEVSLIITALGILAVQGYACRLVRVVDEPLFQAQTAAYREEILPPRLPALFPEPNETPAALARRMLSLFSAADSQG